MPGPHRFPVPPATSRCDLSPEASGRRGHRELAGPLLFTDLPLTKPQRQPRWHYCPWYDSRVVVVRSTGSSPGVAGRCSPAAGVVIASPRWIPLGDPGATRPQYNAQCSGDCSLLAVPPSPLSLSLISLERQLVSSRRAGELPKRCSRSKGSPPEKENVGDGPGSPLSPRPPWSLLLSWAEWSQASADPGQTVATTSSREEALDRKISVAT